jgi:hypothetical protein
LLDLIPMALAFAPPTMRAPAPPPDPREYDAAVRKREDAQTAALADSKSRGRGATVVAGAQIAADEQAGRGLLRSKRRASAMMGL